MTRQLSGTARVSTLIGTYTLLLLLVGDYGGASLAAFLSVAIHGLLIYPLISGHGYRYAAPMKAWLPYLAAIAVVIVTGQWRLPFWYRVAVACLVTVLLGAIYKRLLPSRGNGVESTLPPETGSIGK